MTSPHTYPSSSQAGVSSFQATSRVTPTIHEPSDEEPLCTVPRWDHGREDICGYPAEAGDCGRHEPDPDWGRD